MRREAFITEIVPELGRHDLLPAIIFRTSRNQCDVDVDQAGSSRVLKLAPPAQREFHSVVKDVMRRYEMDEELITTHPHYSALITTGVGAHHAGQLLMWRLLLEELMAGGVLRVLVATGTVAAGVDFPARTVVITAHSRRGAEGFASLTAAELQQMSGRAGRRGKDTVGFCLVAPAPFCDARTVLRISKRPPEPLQSAYFPGPSTVLNLLRYRNVDDLRFTVSRSLAAFTDRKAGAQIIREAEAVEERLSPEEREATRHAEEENEAPESAPQHGGQQGGGHDARERRREGKKLVKRVRRLRRQAAEMAARQEVLLEAALQGLQKLGYVEGSSLSKKGYWAANLCTSVVLELGEIIEAKFLDNVSPEKLAAMVASISGDEHRQYLEVDRDSLTKDEVRRLSEVIQRVTSSGMPGVSDNRKVLLAAANTVSEWLRAENWQQFRGILQLSGVAEGDAARLITQTAEQLNQLGRLMETHPELALKAEDVKRRIMRPPLTEVINFESL
ncbi:MAG: hypothetical protein IT290_08175 [Deltaproteobacteria bacterium]|nr:hypothetical protein [Deltaproteobacteria bacterium]